MRKQQEFKDYPHIRLHPNTKKLLNKLKGDNVSYNSFIVELINKYLGVKK